MIVWCVHTTYSVCIDDPHNGIRMCSILRTGRSANRQDLKHSTSPQTGGKRNEVIITVVYEPVFLRFVILTLWITLIGWTMLLT